MDFREATQELCAGVPQEELARALGVSVATIRQARLRVDAAAYRSPPKDWQTTVIKLAEDRARHYRRLADTLRQDSGSN